MLSFQDMMSENKSIANDEPMDRIRLPRKSYMTATDQSFRPTPLSQGKCHVASHDKKPAVTNRRPWRRLVVTVLILMITMYTIIDFATEKKWAFLQVLGTVIKGEIARSDDTAPVFSKNQTVDIISVGSLLKEHYQDTQQRTFGSHPAVRNFFRITERIDADRECFTELTTDQLDEIIDFCSITKHESSVSSMFRTILFQPKKNVGWMCAQKRPIEGTFHVMQQYRDGMEIPDYLFIIDDDTYINMDSLTDILLKDFPIQTPHIVAGCNFEFLTKPYFPFPYGGFGSYLTKAAIRRLLQPIDCSLKNTGSGHVADPFSLLACWRLNLNAMGEKIYFKDGMSVADLMFKFASEQPFAQVGNWRSGYCFHSDHALAYFLNFYHIAVPDEELKDGVKLNDKVRGKYQFTALTNERGPGRRGECSNERERCEVHNHVCHYIKPDQMEDLYLEKQMQDVNDAAEAIKWMNIQEN
jgi:hypothetical protein